MRISLPPRPGAMAPAKPPGAPVGAAPKPTLPAAAQPKPGAVPARPPATPAGKATAGASAGVRSVVDTDSAGTALAIAALVASLISFGVVVMSFLQK